MIDLLKSLREIADKMGATAPGTGQSAIEAAQQLAISAQKHPRPVPQVIQDIVNDIGRIRSDTTVAELARQWNADVDTLCRDKIGGKYPVNLAVRTDVDPRDFILMFGKGQRIDAFIQRVDAYLDRGTRQWQWRTDARQALGLPPAIPPLLQLATDIREAFFAGGGELRVDFTLLPIEGQQKGCSLEIGGATMSLEPDARKSDFKWPSGAGRDARVTCGTGGPYTHEGAWAFYRLMNEARPSGGPASWKLSHRSGVILQLDFQSDKNPLAIRDRLKDFKCVSFSQQ